MPQSATSTPLGRIGKSQYKLLLILHAAGAEGCTTAELESKTKLHIRTVQYSMKRLHEFGLVQRFNLKHNKHRWYYSENAADFLTHWPQLPPNAKASSR